jgi:hypothetical protein
VEHTLLVHFLTVLKFLGQMIINKTIIQCLNPKGLAQWLDSLGL